MRSNPHLFLCLRQSLSLRRISDNYFLESGMIYSMIQYNFFLLIPILQHLSDNCEFQSGGKHIPDTRFLLACHYFSPSLFAYDSAHVKYLNLTDDYITMYDWQSAFNRKHPGYFRTDFQMVYRVNRRRHAFECGSISRMLLIIRMHLTITSIL